MGFFKSIGNAFKKVVKAVTSTVGKVVLGVAAVVAAPFTGGLSLLALPAVLAAGRNNVKSLGKFTGANPVGEPIKEEPVKRYPVKEPPPEVPSIVSLEAIEPFSGSGAITGKKETVTLTGYYYDINRVSIPVDTDLTNVIIVPETFFPYVAIIDNHLPSDNKRYISEFTYTTLSIAHQNNLDKVIHDLDKDNGNFVYINFNWQEFVDKYLSQGKGLNTDGGILYWSITPSFMLQWLDGGTTTSFPLEYSYKIPAGVKTVFDLKGDSDVATTAPRTFATIPEDPKRRDRIANILSGIGAGVAYANLAIAAVGGIKSRLDNATGAIKNLSKTAKDLNDKFKNFRPIELSKDMINGKIQGLKNLVNTKLPKIPSIKSFFKRKEAVLEAEVVPNKKELRRAAKDKKVRGKFGLKSVTGALDKVEGKLSKVTSKVDKVVSKIPKIPPAALNLAQKLASNGGKIDIGSLVSVGLPNLSNINLANFVPNFSNINWSDPLAAIDGITAGINGVNSLGERVLSLDLKTNSQKQAELSAINQAKQDAIISQFQTTAKADLQNYLKTIPLSTPLPKTPVIVSAISRNTSPAATNAGGLITVTSDRAYFHSNPNVASKRNAYIIKGQGGTFTKVENNFGFLRFTNTSGVVTEGWLKISDTKAG
jgi:hypothetical protein